jgi:hypothetical protein
VCSYQDHLPVAPLPPPSLPLPVALGSLGSFAPSRCLASRSSAPMHWRLRQFWRSCGRAVGRSGIGFAPLRYLRALALGSFVWACVQTSWPVAVRCRVSCVSRPRVCPRRSWKGRRKCCPSRAWWPLPVLGTGRRFRLRRLCVWCSRLAVQFVSGVPMVWMPPYVLSRPTPSHSRLKTFQVWPLFNSRPALALWCLALRLWHCFHLHRACSGRVQRWRSSVR